MSSQSTWWRISVLLIVSAIITLGTSAAIGSYVDANGILHEPFFLVPIFWVLSFASITSAIVALIVRRAR